jgi:putative ABC transport system permease protein
MKAGWVAVLVALGALRVNTIRTILTMLGIVIGVAAVIVMVSVGAGAQQRLADQLRSVGSNLIIVSPGSSTARGTRQGLGSLHTLTTDDARAIATEAPAVEVAAPSVRGAVQAVYGNLNWSTWLHGVTPDFLDAREWSLASGKMFIPEDVDGATKVAVLGDTVWRSLFADSEPIGQTIRIRNVPFTVIGVLEPKGQNAAGQDQDDAVLIPLSTAKRKVLGINRSSPRAVVSVTVRVRDVTLMEEARDQIRALLRQRHRLQPGQDDDFQVQVLTDLFATQDESARVMTTLLAAIASVSLLVGGIGIMNIMLVSISERMREIGLRMAVGARRRDIRRQFLIEAMTLSALGGCIGIAVGVLVSLGIAALAEWPIALSVQAMAVAFLFAGTVGVTFGLYPAQKAARLDPIEALRYE